MDYKEFFAAIREEALSGAYLLHGDEEYVKESALSQLLARIEDAVRDMNVDNLYTANAKEIIAACETLPFLARRRVVIVRALPKEQDAEEIRAYLPRMPQESVLLFFLRGAADNRLALVKALTAQKRAVLFAPLQEHDASRWLRQQANSASVTLSEQDAAFFIALAGTDCSKLNNEMQKAAAYAGDGRVITREIIAKVVTRDLDYVVFSVLDDVIAGRVRDGFAALAGLIENGEQPMEIASRIGEKARLILQARRLIERKLPKDAVQRNLGVSSGYAWRVYEAARLMNPARTQALSRCAKALCDVSTLQLTGRAKARDALEQALLILAS